MSNHVRFLVVVLVVMLLVTLEVVTDSRILKQVKEHSLQKVGGWEGDIQYASDQPEMSSLVVNLAAGMVQSPIIDSKENNVVTFVVHLGGELGNHLQYLARAIALVHIAKNQYNLNAKLVLKQQTNTDGSHIIGKARHSETFLKQCFPGFRTHNFALGNSREYELRVQQQKNWTLVNNTVLNYFDGSIKGLHLAMEHLQALSKSFSIPMVEAGANIPLPMADISSMSTQQFTDKFYHVIRDSFAFDETKCCNEKPEPDESVFVSKFFKE
jgi:hypothetical protein